MAENSVTIEETLSTLLANKKYSSVKDILTTMNPTDIASILDNLDEQHLPILFRLLPKELAADTFVEMEAEHQELLIKGFSDRELKQVLDEMYVDDAVDIVEEMPANVVRRILDQATADMRRDINQILRYPEDSAGSVMTTEYISLKSSMTVSDALSHIRKNGVDKETIYTCYVTENRKLIGLVSVKDLLLAKDDEMITDIMQENVISATTHTDQEEVAQLFNKYNFLAIPIVDSEGRMVGIVTVDDAIDVMEEETTEDMALMSGQTPTDKPYLKSSPFEFFIHRIPWLVIMMIGSTFTGIIINRYETALAANAILTAFIPMLMGTGGNSGAQASVAIIRSISIGELEFKDLGRVILKELLTSILCGIALAAACFGKMMLIDRLLLSNPDLTATVSITVSFSMALTVICAKTLGGLLPLIAKKLGFDPAVMASPLITTCVDALSLIIYFCVANFFLF